MTTPSKTIDHGTLHKLVDAGVVRGVDVIGLAGGWGILVKYGMVERPLVAHTGAVRKFGRFETLANYLKGLGIAQCQVNVSEFDPDARRARPDSAARMRTLYAASATGAPKKNLSKRRTAAAA